MFSVRMAVTILTHTSPESKEATSIKSKQHSSRFKSQWSKRSTRRAGWAVSPIWLTNHPCTVRSKQWELGTKPNWSKGSYHLCITALLSQRALREDTKLPLSTEFTQEWKKNKEKAIRHNLIKVTQLTCQSIPRRNYSNVGGYGIEPVRKKYFFSITRGSQCQHQHSKGLRFQTDWSHILHVSSRWTVTI